MIKDVDAAMRGALAGAIATLPMSGVMYAAEKLKLMGEYPPEKIAGKILEAAGGPPDEEVNDALATVAHLGFGAMAGALYGVAASRLDLPLAPVAQGIAFGLLVYAVSYNGWLPAAHLMPEPEHDRPGRQPSMVAAHLVYGGVLGELMGRESA